MDRFAGRISKTPATLANTAQLPEPATSAKGMAAARPALPSATASGAVATLLQGLTARIDALEMQLRQLQACTLQQWPDGRVHLPAGNRLQIEIGNTRLAMDVATFTVEANGQVLVSGKLLTQPRPTSQSAGSLQSMAPQPGSWQSSAQQNAMSDPRSPGSGVPLGTNP